MRQLSSLDIRVIAVALDRMHGAKPYSTDHGTTEIATSGIGRLAVRRRTDGGISRAMEMGPRGSVAWRRSGLRANTRERTQCA